jgi:hypothetical protein
MTNYVILTNEPERLRRAYAYGGVAVTPFDTAVDALVWERRQRSEGAVVLESRGWRFGVVFNLDAQPTAS